jgi:hypothetical protein
MNLAFIFSNLPFRFPLEEKKSCLQSLRRLSRVTSFSRYPLVEIIVYENQDDLCFLWDCRFWILTTQPSHFYTLAYCWPIYLISIEFQNIDNNLGSPSKKTFLSSSNVIILQSVRWVTAILFTNYQDSKVQDLTIERRKRSFYFEAYPTCSEVHIWGPIFTKTVLKI